MAKKECDKGGCTREQWGNDKHCIFHSENIEGKKVQFNDEFKKEFNRQKKDEKEKEYDFLGFVFPYDVSFQKEIFDKNVDFRQTKFKGLAFFDDVVFPGEVLFTGSQFAGVASFVGTQFSEFTTFERSHFFKKADFRRAKFHKKVNFEESKFSEETNFFKTQFSGITLFNSAKFFKDTNFCDIKVAKYQNFMMLNTYFYDVSGLFDFIEENRKNFKSSEKTEFLPDNFRLIIGEDTIAKHPIISRKVRDDMYLLKFKEKHERIFKLWWLFADCGRSFWRWALWSLGIAILFGIIFSPSPEWFPDCWENICDKIGPQFTFTTEGVSNQPIGLLSLIYFSFVTFTTLGAGDIAAVNATARILVIIEVFLGYVMLGILISILANKLARRS